MSAHEFASRLGWLALLLAGLCGSASAHSLFDPSAFRALTADRKAYQVGDPITVQIVEDASAVVNADTSSARRNSLSMEVVPARSGRNGASVRVDGDFDGGGRTGRTGRLLAQITVTVREVLPGGDLHIAGTQQLTINDEAQRIALSGRVRPQDISDGNIVLSSRIADADITYVGEGHLSDRQQRAWWRRLLDVMGL